MNKGTEYELLVKRLMGVIADRSPRLSTTALRHDVNVDGRSGPNQIDVLWELVTDEGSHRVAFECRNYATPLKRAAVHAFRSIIDDINSVETPTTGVMVTLTGYQSGALAVAATYDIAILQLRPPTEADLYKRVQQINFVPFLLTPWVGSDIAFEFREVPDPSWLGIAARYEVSVNGGPSRDLYEVLLSAAIRNPSELGVPRQKVRCSFDPPAQLLREKVTIGTISAVTGSVGEDAAASTATSIGGRASLVFMMKNVLTQLLCGLIETTGPTSLMTRMKDSARLRLQRSFLDDRLPPGRLR